MAGTCRGSSRGECAELGALSARHAVSPSVAGFGGLDAVDAEVAAGGGYVGALLFVNVSVREMEGTKLNDAARAGLGSRA
jgi:hypothetical protein